MSVGIFYRYHIVLRRLKCVRTLKMKSPSRLGPVEIVLVPLKVWTFLETEVGAHSVLCGHGGLLLWSTDESGAGALSPLAGASSQRCCSGHWNPMVILWAVPSVKLWWTLCKVPMAVGWPVWGTECLGPASPWGGARDHSHWTHAYSCPRATVLQKSLFRAILVHWEYPGFLFIALFYRPKLGIFKDKLEDFMQVQNLSG